jgi:hypothetical protein
MYKNFYTKKKNTINNIQYQRKLVGKISKNQLANKVENAMNNAHNFTKYNHGYISRLISICKLSGTLKKTLKKTNIGRHSIRLNYNTKHYVDWQKNT